VRFSDSGLLVFLKSLSDQFVVSFTGKLEKHLERFPDSCHNFSLVSRRMLHYILKHVEPADRVEVETAVDAIDII